MGTDEVIQILTENYFTLAATGAQAVEAVWGDIAEGHFAGQCEEWGISMTELVTAVNEFALWLATAGHLTREAHSTSIGLFS
jgi:hypothetical protein